MNDCRVRLNLEEFEGRLVLSSPGGSPMLNPASAVPEPVETHKVLSLELNQLDGNRDGKIDANYTVSVRVVLDNEVVKLLTLEFAAGSTMLQAQQAAAVQLNGQQAIGTSWDNDAGKSGIYIGFLDGQNFANVDEGSASIIKVNGNDLNPPFRLVTQLYDLRNK